MYFWFPLAVARKKLTWFTVQSITAEKVSKDKGHILPHLGNLHLTQYRETDTKISLKCHLGKVDPAITYLLSQVFPWWHSHKALSMKLISLLLPIFSLRLLSQQTVFSKISTDSACYFCFVLLSTQGYDFSTWCISALNSIEKKTRPQRVMALMKTMSLLVRSPTH